MSTRHRLPSRMLCALGALALGATLPLAPALAQVSPAQVSPTQVSPPSSDTTRAKPAIRAKKTTPKRTKSAELPAIGGPAIKQKAGEEKPKVKRPFGELEGWSNASEAEKKVLPTPRDQSSTKRSPVQINGSGNMGMGIDF